MIAKWFGIFAESSSCAVASPYAFALALSTILVWLALGPVFDWSDTHSLLINTVTTVTTYIMVFILQNSQLRNEKAIQAKLDELVRATEKASNSVAGIEHRIDPSRD